MKIKKEVFLNKVNHQKSLKSMNLVIKQVLKYLNQIKDITIMKNKMIMMIMNIKKLMIIILNKRKKMSLIINKRMMIMNKKKKITMSKEKETIKILN